MPRRTKSPERADPNLTPLLDVVLQLIAFFLMLVHFGTRVEGARQEIRLPVAPAALPGTDLALERLVVALDSDGRLRVEDHDEPLDGDAARRWWAEQAAERRSVQRELGGPGGELPTVVVVRADRDATYGALRRMLAEAQMLGFARFSLVVIRELDR
jgi:biopolymer transport protein ExbD